MKKTITVLITCFIISSFSTQLSFKDAQLKYPRVKQAYKDKSKCISKLLKSHNISNAEIYIRAFKLEEKIEVWAKEKTDVTYKLITSYPFCFSSGGLGPKRQQGDYQIPEGFYVIDRFNPESNFHLSLGINYPNASDKIKSNHHRLGGDIFIHGSCFSVGCIPITDDWIEELYILSVEAKNAGQTSIPVHIFPFYLNEDNYEKHIKDTSISGNHSKFWTNLKEGYAYFETNRTVPTIEVSEEGHYIFK
ncbi:L,D-transpeptidase family protein [Psychroserpens luteolus]|uniref:L,D-transpeptidase family protein n=1 Tax=Psychroserpens luteolus TaxID=2855840 RepID=UPI001E65919E|nr:hypothetical protein [Psychroserpens luteolus]MCD2259667.1 hypothetical protein [Psychroserpens luteolus]